MRDFKRYVLYLEDKDFAIEVLKLIDKYEVESSEEVVDIFNSTKLEPKDELKKTKVILDLPPLIAD